MVNAKGIAGQENECKDYLEKKLKYSKKTKKKNKTKVDFTSIWYFDKKIILVPLVAVLCFVNTWNHEFTFDDLAAIQKNKDLLPETPLYNIFINNYWGSPIKHLNAHKSYRPITTLTFKANYLLTGLNSYSYHIGNIIFHAISSYLACVLCFTLFYNKKTALLSGLLFAVHPLHCDSVASAVGRADVLGAIFFCLSLIFFQKSVGFFRSSNANLYTAGRTNWLLFGISILFSVIGLLSKELAYVSVILFGVYEIAALYRERRIHFYGTRKISLVIAVRCLYQLVSSPLFPVFAVRQLTNLFFCCVTMYGRYLITGATRQYILSHFNYISELPDKLGRGLSISYFHFLHWWPLVYPVNLCCDASYNSVELVTSLYDPRVFIIVFFNVFMLLVLPYKFLVTEPDHSAPLLVSYFIGLLPFLPCANLFWWAGFEIAERIMYMPSFGFCFVVGHFISQALFAYANPESPKKSSQKRNKKALFSAYAAVACLLLVLAGRTIRRNMDWANSLTLWESAIKVYPNNTKAHYNYANELILLGDHASREKALEHYNKCFSVRYDGFYTMNYGKALLLMGHVKEAEEIFWRGINEPLRALDGTPVHQDYLYNALGELYIAQQKWEKARECFKGAALYLMSPYKLPENFLLTLNPTFKNLRLYTIVNENTTNFKSKLLKIDELLSNNYPERELSEGQLMFRNHNVSNALNWYADALLKYPGHKILMFETAILFYINKKFDDALYLLCNFIKLEKFHSDAYSLMGSMLQEQKRTTDALVMANLLNNLKDYEKNIAILEAARLEANRH